MSTDDTNEPIRTLAATVSIAEKPTSHDHRSFAAVTFGSVAFKMLEWLTPQSLNTISNKISQVTSPTSQATPAIESPRPLSSKSSKLSTPSPYTPQATPPLDIPKPTIPADAPLKHQSGSLDDIRVKKSADGKIHASPITRSSRRESVDSKRNSADVDDVTSPFKSPTSGAFLHDKLGRKTRSETTTITISDIPHGPPFFENVSPPIRKAELPILPTDKRVSDVAQEQPKEVSLGARAVAELKVSDEDVSIDDYPLPQSLRELNVEIIDFICDVYRDDRTIEHMFDDVEHSDGFPTPENAQPRLKRRATRNAESAKQWKAFNDQVLFDLLSAPESLVSSFTQNGQVYDSQTLWYCMVRLNRAAPSVVLHSLWIAASSLFVPPTALKLGSSSTKSLRQKPLTRHQAGCIMAAAFHALVSLAPVVSGSRALYDMSRIRSNGLAFTNTTPFSRYSANITLQYDDCFSNPLAMRLARRLFRGLTAQRYFTELTSPNGKVKDEDDVLHLLLNQLDLLNTGPARILEFDEAERLLHETRVPTLLLDWARAVLLDGWDECPVFRNDGPFHGALSFMDTMYRNRNILLLGDIQFRVDSFSDRLDTTQVPVSWLSFESAHDKHHILDYPFLFRPETLVTFFRAINFSRMSRNYEEASSLKRRMTTIVEPGSLITHPHHRVILHDMLKTASSFYLVLDIGRSNVLRDAFDQLWRRQTRELLRPLKVHLGEDGGEEGFDSGGVQQEFFRMAIAECFDPDYGAFTVDDRTRMAWFVPGSIVEEWKFELIGLLMSLAIYNGLTLPVTFPKALYRKLLGEPVRELYHIADGWPELAAGLTTLLEWDEKDGLVEDIFARTYEFSVPCLGQNVTYEMTKEDFAWPQSVQPAPPAEEEAPLVTNDNRDDYVSDYIRYLTDVSTRPQFEAFQRGFRTCLEPKSLTLLTPPILQSIVEGIQEIDISELRRQTRYVGWDSSHRTIRDFWSIVKRYDDRMKRKLLEFVTASDRVPVGGLRNLQFVVQKNGEEETASGHLPTAYTCYGTLLLPEYPDKEVLRERLSMALENAQGFGFA